ncbi:MAG: mannose-1-phosphate guanylyltransferase/mannose-6-phosphate isomerase, partial [Coriobacteriales bacterium]|nr:mannose-1-phosphate guanylyltransferase/mannose-6-phosphate isomerase [Coriobacteriales bacterium]
MTASPSPDPTDCLPAAIHGHCVLLSGGGGLRLWPLSRRDYPKQFLALDGGESLFSKAIRRNLGLFDAFTVITNESYRFIVLNELERVPELNGTNAPGEPGTCSLILEPMAKNTTTAIAIAALRSAPDEIMLVAPTDALISGEMEYHAALTEAKDLALAGFIVTFGIKPNSPRTGYGYIRHQGNDVIRFVEKPDAATARDYLEQGEYLWNSGMFMFRASTMLAELAEHCGDLLAACRDLLAASQMIAGQNLLLLDANKMAPLPAVSIDYALIEKSRKIKVVPAAFAWSDVGGLEAFAEMSAADSCGNRSSGDNNIFSDCQNTSIINRDDGSLVVAQGLSDVIIATTDNAVYVSKRDSSAKIKDIIAAEAGGQKRFFDEGTRVYRPWGYYQVLDEAPGYKVKLITVLPDKSLSLQRHFHRSEHWVVVRGVATITKAKKTEELQPNQSSYIPIGVVPRL